MKYIDADKLKELLKERQEEKDYREVIWLIDSLQQEQPVEGLEDEAINYCFDKGINLSPRQAADFARHFAEWGAKQIKSND